MNQHDLLAKAERYLPGACLGMMPLPPDLRMVMVRGQGSKVYDAAGKEYLDYMLGSGPLLLGHAHPAVVDEVQRQAAKGSSTGIIFLPMSIAPRRSGALPLGGPEHGYAEALCGIAQIGILGCERDPEPHCQL